MTRERLPLRRGSTVLDFQHGGVDYTVGWSRYEDGRVAELFLNAGKLDSGVDTIARDSAIVASLALQNGCSVNDLRSSLTRTGFGGPAGPLAYALDLIAAADEPPAALVDTTPRVPRHPVAPSFPG